MPRLTGNSYSSILPTPFKCSNLVFVLKNSLRRKKALKLCYLNLLKSCHLNPSRDHRSSRLAVRVAQRIMKYGTVLFGTATNAVAKEIIGLDSVLISRFKYRVLVV